MIAASARLGACAHPHLEAGPAVRFAAPKSRRRCSRGANRVVVVNAAATTTGATDLQDLLADALKQSSTVGSRKAAGSGARFSSSNVLESATNSSTAASQAANAAKDAAVQGTPAASDLKQATATAAQNATPPPPPPLADNAATSAVSRASDALQQSPSTAAPTTIAQSAVESAVPSLPSTNTPLQDAPAANAAADFPNQFADGAQSALTSAQDAANGALSSAQEAASGTLSSVQEAASGAITAAQDTVSGLLGSLQGTFSGLVDSSRQAAEGLTSNVRTAADSSLSVAQETTSDVLSRITGVTAGLEEAVQGATSVVLANTQEIRGAASDAAASAVSQLPPPAQEALFKVKAVASQLLDQVGAAAAANPETTRLLFYPALGIPALLWLASLFDGFGGDLQPQDIFELLQKEEALLVDIRDDRDRVANGLPELARGALGKGVVVPLYAVYSKGIRKPRDLAAEVTALTISELNKRKRSTTVIVLDRGDGKAVPVAKQLSRFGVQRAYVVSGGFRRWVQAGLPVMKDRVDYDVSSLALLGARTGVVVDETAAFFRNPVALVLAGAGAALGVGLIVDWHRALQYLGTSSLLFTAAIRATTYESPEDVVEDVSGISSAVGGPLAAIASPIVGTTKQVVQKLTETVQKKQEQQRQQRQSTRPPALQNGVQSTEPVVEVFSGAVPEEAATIDSDSSSSS